jgi:Coenzyme PQQ synthesis protein D (PqqD)
MSLKQTEQTILESSIVVAASEQISSDLGGEAVVLNLKSGVYHGLNDVGARIWTLIQQPKVVKDIKLAILEEYDVELERCENDLVLLLNDLSEAGLIQIKNEVVV